MVIMVPVVRRQPVVANATQVTMGNMVTMLTKALMVAMIIHLFSGWIVRTDRQTDTASFMHLVQSKHKNQDESVCLVILMSPKPSNIVVMVAFSMEDHVLAGPEGPWSDETTHRGGKTKSSANGRWKLNWTTQDVTFDHNDQFQLLP
jgi:hypothetical protein